MPFTIKDVAHRAGVSSATVSRVLTHQPHVSEEVGRGVLAAIEELDYQPSPVASSLRIHRTYIIYYRPHHFLHSKSLIFLH